MNQQACTCNIKQVPGIEVHLVDCPVYTPFYGPNKFTLIEPESILLEAQRLTHGPRNQDYGHPLDDYERTAALINALFEHKLKTLFTASEAAMIMCLVKLSRQAHKPKRDNLVDLAGYVWVVQECLDEEVRRRTEQAARHE